MKRLWIVIMVLVVALAGVIVWQVLKPSEPSEPEPVYNGKRLSEWLKFYADATDRFPTLEVQQEFKNTDSAMRQIGTNAIPSLLRLLRVKDSTLTVKLLDLLQEQHVIKIKYTRASYWNLAAGHGFQVLGAKAQNAVPALIEIVNANISPSSQYCSLIVLANIGPSAKDAVPSLLQWVTNADGAVRLSATNALLLIDPEAAAKAGIKTYGGSPR
jgi:hypothetical protein